MSNFSRPYFLQLSSVSRLQCHIRKRGLNSCCNFCITGNFPCQYRYSDIDIDDSFETIGASTLEHAAKEAAVADGVLILDANSKSQQQAEFKPKKMGLRRGKWTGEEEGYANRLIMEFKAGCLPLTDGTTLRTFLSKLLNCDPMRISKKFVGGNCIGKVDILS